MFLNSSQLKSSLEELKKVHPFFGTAFLAMKKANLPVGEAESDINFTSVVNEVMFRFYKPIANYEGFYSPFLTSDKANRWLNKRYASTTLQRITVDTFAKVFLHTKKTQEWGWEANYIEVLKEFVGNNKVPLFHLAVWLFRQELWPNTITRAEISQSLLSRFFISDEEASAIFDLSEPQFPEDWLQEEPLTDEQILDLIGYPRDAPSVRGAIIQSLELTEVGPTAYFHYEPADRLNVITGNNSLGKTFLFDCIWWAITGSWMDSEARPRPDALLKTPRLSYTVKTGDKKHEREQKIECRYDWGKQQWVIPKVNKLEVGLALYARFDGSFAVWDSARRDLIVGNQKQTSSSSLHLSRDQVWNGLLNEDGKSWACNGLIRDWVSWQLSGPRYEKEWNALKACLKNLAPNEHSLVAGEPTRVDAQDAREIPTIMMPYGTVPLTHTSAGVQRALGLAYMLVWVWFRHLSNAEVLRQEPQNRVVIIIDEVEAHLHPQWQRVLIPAIMGAVESLASSISPQIHIATHSPMVMTSTEVIFNEEQDDLHHLRLENKEVVLEELPFRKRGTSDFWLMSETFGLDLPRSLPAERAIKQALRLQLEESVTSNEVHQTNEALKQSLGDGDEFWPRWRYFALQHGVD